ncbi:hypothetical protein ACLB2K_066832 [Fragaria x ananassa]
MLFFCLRLTQSRANPIPVHLFPKNPTITITITTPTSLFCSALLLSVFNLLYPLRGLTLSSETKQQQSSELFSIFKPNLCCSVTVLASASRFHLSCGSFGTSSSSSCGI